MEPQNLTMLSVWWYPLRDSYQYSKTRAARHRDVRSWTAPLAGHEEAVERCSIPCLLLGCEGAIIAGLMSNHKDFFTQQRIDRKSVV